jgi:D-tyrosyl-tRNA(Tyr) deacylase
MRVLIQRVTNASVTVEGRTSGSIGRGLLVFAGISRDDTLADVEYCAEKILGLRVFPDDAGKMNRSVVDTGGSVLVISQFTLLGDCRKGRRPSFDRAAPPAQAVPLYHYLLEVLQRGPVPVASGVFQAHMEVRLLNDGPVTLWIDSEDKMKK